jgi:hypothetical protein
MQFPHLLGVGSSFFIYKGIEHIRVRVASVFVLCVLFFLLRDGLTPLLRVSREQNPDVQFNPVKRHSDIVHKHEDHRVRCTGIGVRVLLSFCRGCDTMIEDAPVAVL